MGAAYRLGEGKGGGGGSCIQWGVEARAVGASYRLGVGKGGGSCIPADSTASPPYPQPVRAYAEHNACRSRQSNLPEPAPRLDQDPQCRARTSPATGPIPSRRPPLGRAAVTPRRPTGRPTLARHGTRAVHRGSQRNPGTAPTQPLQRGYRTHPCRRHGCPCHPPACSLLRTLPNPSTTQQPDPEARSGKWSRCELRPVGKYRPRAPRRCDRGRTNPPSAPALNAPSAHSRSEPVGRVRGGRCQCPHNGCAL
eukprot:scaffold1021_cov108-Isochrysis_galbana.AAC.11